MLPKRFISVDTVDRGKFAFEVDDVLVIREHELGSEIVRSDMNAKNIICKNSVDELVNKMNSTLIYYSK